MMRNEQSNPKCPLLLHRAQYPIWDTYPYQYPPKCVHYARTNAISLLGMVLMVFAVPEAM